MLSKEKDVQGVGVYAEFRKTGQVMQVIITPDAYTTAGTLVPMTFVRRVITPSTPRKQWKTSILRSKELEEIVESGGTLQDSAKENFTELRMRHATSYFDSVISQGWALEKTPLLVEVSRGDADDLAKGKTPNKILYRVHLSRKALAFPDLV